MADIKDVGEIAGKWARVTPGRAPEYEAGVRAPKRDWRQATAGAEGAYDAGVQSGIARKAFGKGVAAAGTEKWQRGAIEKGTARFGPGVQVAQSEYARGFAPYADVIRSTVLPPRAPRRDPRNLERVRVMVNALAQKKVGGAK